MLSDRLTNEHFEIYGENLDKINPTICISKGNKKFECIGTSNISDLALLKFGNGGTVIFPYYIEKDGNRIENITDETQNIFKTKLKNKNITKHSIFYYIYAIFHNQNYRKTNSTLLERNLPKIPIDITFTELSKLGQRLFELHSNFENANKYPLKVSKLNSKNDYSIILKFSKDKKNLIVDSEVIIENIPLVAYEYKVGNLSPIEWIVKMYRPLSPSKKDLRSYPKIFSDFNNFENEKKRFKKGRIEFIDLISKLITVSTETVKLENQINSIKIK
ncbi:hypothetical protein CH359_19320 [Leptospira meyeri]|nr:hypothetical protein CH359_19320 [Leptospira meyeri]